MNEEKKEKVMNAQKKEQIEQFKLAINIIENDLPWEYLDINGRWYRGNSLCAAVGLTSIRVRRESDNKFLKAFKEGKRVQWGYKSDKSWTSGWNEFQENEKCNFGNKVYLGDPTFNWRILTTKTVPLNYDDVMPGTSIRHENGDRKDCVGAVLWDGIKLWTGHFISWEELKKFKFWNGTAWIPCTKQLEEVEE